MLNYVQFYQEQSIYYIISDIYIYGYIAETNCSIFTPPGEITEAEGNDNIILLKNCILYLWPAKITTVLVENVLKYDKTQILIS